MGFQTVLAVNLMALAALSLLLGLLQRRRDLASFALVNALVLVVGGLALWAVPEEAGALVSLAFLPFVAAPMVFGALQARLTRAGRLDAAARCAALTAFFHPTAAMRLSAAFARAAAIADPEEKARRFAALSREAPPALAAPIEARLLAERGEWERVLDIASRPENARGLAGYRLRALGETGRIEALMRDYARSQADLPIEQTAFSWLFVLAFAGRVREVEALATQMMRLDAASAAYWVAVAQRQAGDVAGARDAFRRLASNAAETPASVAARRQLAAGWIYAPLSPQARRVAEDVAERVSIECERRARGWRLPPATFSLLCANAAMFAAEIAFGGSQNVETLIALGALWPPLALHGEQWRLLTSTLLHYGPLHFGLNMLMLSLIGRDLEHEAGAAAMLTAYLGGALFSSVVVLVLMASGAAGYGLYVGASGAIFALFGVVGALRLKDWRRHRATLDAFRASALGLAMLVQIGADFLLPMSSLAAHLSGFVFGLAAGLFMTPKRAQTRIGIST